MVLLLGASDYPFGTHNVTYPGSVTTRQVVRLIEKGVELDEVHDAIEQSLARWETAA